MNEKELLIYQSGRIQGKIDVYTFYFGRIDQDFDEEIQRKIDKAEQQREEIENKLLNM